LHLSPAAVERIKNLGMTDKGRRSEFLISIGEDSASTHSLYIELTPTEYWLATSFPRERQYRTWWLSTHTNLEFGENIRRLAPNIPTDSRGCRNCRRNVQERSTALPLLQIPITCLSPPPMRMEVPLATVQSPSGERPAPVRHQCFQNSLR
jgi:hypothetical protein